MEKFVFNTPSINNSTPYRSKLGDDAELLNEHVHKFIEELTKGHPPQEAARHAEDFKNTKLNYFLDKIRHRNYWKRV